MRLNLNGTWDLKWGDGERGGLPWHSCQHTKPKGWLKGTVPGEVHIDLIEQGFIEEVTEGLGCLTSRWVEEMYWSYRRDFELPAGIDLQKQKVWINFGGLDYTAIIFINGQEIGRTENAFRQYSFEISKYLQAGTNTITVSLESGIFNVGEKTSTGHYLANEGLHRVDELLHKKIWLRKPQSSTSWDWAPRLLNVGITGDVELFWHEAVRPDQLSVLATVDGSVGHVKVRYFVEGAGEACKHKVVHYDYGIGTPLYERHLPKPIQEETQKAILRVKVLETGMVIEKELNVYSGLNPLELEFDMNNVKLWWCVGFGEQNLYNIEVTLIVNGKEIASGTKKVGFRTVKINQDPNSMGGTNFIIELNGEKVFAVGSNFVPADIIFQRIKRDTYETLVDRALELNFNILRVWGGGLYESDDFYDVCNEKGMLVWQEFIFACGSYPIQDEHFYANIKEEFRQNIRRLANNPSLIIWCGNNEQEWLTWDRNNGIIYPDHALYHMTIPRILNEEDPTRFYHPSSPMSPNLKAPGDFHSGDQHPWNVGFFNEDFRDYRKMDCTFPNEGGFLGCPTLTSVEKSLVKGQEFYNSFAWQFHDNALEFSLPYSIVGQQLMAWTGIDIETLSIEENVFLTGFLQGEALTEYIANFRRRTFETAAAIFWMYNDCWATTRSWTVVDWKANRNPSFYPVGRASKPIFFNIVLNGETVEIYGINATTEETAATINYGILALDNCEAFNKVEDITLPRNCSTLVASFPKAEWDKFGETNAIAFVKATKDGEVISRNRLILPYFVDMNLKKTNIEINQENGYVTLKADTFTMGVCLDLRGETKLHDNFFDLYPNEEYKIKWDSKTPFEILYTYNQFKK